MTVMNNIFPILIYQKNYTGDLNKLQDDIIPNMEPVVTASTENNQLAMRNGAVCSAVSNLDLYNMFDLSELESFVRSCALEYCNKLGYREANIIVASTWINKYPKGGYIDNHHHAPSIMGATFYLNKPNGSGDLVFENPIAALRRYEPFKALGHANAYAEDSTILNHKIEVKEGDLVLFPGWILHRTEPNMSNGDRIVIGFDIVLD